MLASVGGWSREEAGHHCNPCRGGRYDSDEDRSLSPHLRGLKFLVDISSKWPSQHSTAYQPTSRSTPGKQTLAYR
jgi:hypothetical protein